MSKWNVQVRVFRHTLSGSKFWRWLNGSMYNHGFGFPHYPVPALAYQFDVIISPDYIVLMYLNRSDKTAWWNNKLPIPWHVAYEYPPFE